MDLLSFKRKTKKNKIHYGIVVLTIGVMVCLGGCGGEYLPEKYLYKARQKAGTLKLDSAKEQEINVVIDAYRIVTKRWPLSTNSIKAHFEIAQLLTMQELFSESREELEVIVVNFSNKADVAADAKFAIGQIYEREGNNEAAVKTYQELYDLYPLTKRGLNCPLYIAEFYKRNNDIDSASKAYDEALDHYTKKLQELGEIKLSAGLQNYIALTYASQGLWQEAVTNWEIIPKKYPESMLVPITLLTVGEVYYAKLKERSKAIERYTAVVDEYDGTEFKTRAMIKLVQIHFMTGDYSNTRDWCHALISNAKGNRELEAQANIIIGRCYEKEAEWETAENIYHNVMNNYGDTSASLRVPIFLALHFQEEEQSGEVQRIYQDALSEYERIMSDETTTRKMRKDALDLTNLIYAKQENWQQVIENLENVHNAAGENVHKKANALFAIGFMYQHKVNDKSQARAVYNKFLELYPDHPLEKSVQMQIEKLDVSEQP